MDWTIKNERDANHNPEVIVNGSAGKAPVEDNGSPTLTSYRRVILTIRGN